MFRVLILLRPSYCYRPPASPVYCAARRVAREEAIKQPGRAALIKKRTRNGDRPGENPSDDARLLPLIALSWYRDLDVEYSAPPGVNRWLAPRLRKNTEFQPRGAAGISPLPDNRAAPFQRVVGIKMFIARGLPTV